MLKALAGLSPQDRLLARDTQRCKSRLERAWEARQALLSCSAGGRSIRLERALTLPDGTWEAFAADHGMLYAAGYKRATGDRADLAEALAYDWAGQHARILLRQLYHEHEPLILAADPQRRHRLLLATRRGRRLTQRSQPVGRETLSVGVPDGAPDGIAAAAYDELGQLWLLVADEREGHIEVFSSDGRLLVSRQLDCFEGKTVPDNVSIVARRGDCWVAADTRLILLRPDRPAEAIEFDVPVVNLAATLPAAPLRMAVTFVQGGAVLAADEWPLWTAFGQDMAAPVAAFTDDGHLVAACTGGGRVYRFREGRLSRVGDFDLSARSPAAVLSTCRRGEFAVAAGKTVYLYSIT